MSKSTRIIVIMLSLILMVVGVGCVAVSKFFTPADINKKAVEYVVKTRVADANDFKGWANLLKAIKLEKDVDSAHDIIQLMLEQEIQKDNLEYSIHRDVTANNRQIGEQRAEIVFGEKGLLTLGLSMAGFGGLTGLVGLMRKRPGDVTSQELGLAVEQATGKSNGDLLEKNKQLVEVVKGVQKFINTYRDTTDNKEAVMINNLKELSSKAQDTQTQIAVATIKKGLV